MWTNNIWNGWNYKDCPRKFNLGVFWIAITTFSNLMVHSKRYGRPITAICPVMVCYCKTTKQYRSFFHEMVAEKPKLGELLRAFGQDGEKAIFDTHSKEFPFSISFICSNFISRVTWKTISNQHSIWVHKKCRTQMPNWQKNGSNRNPSSKTTTIFVGQSFQLEERLLFMCQTIWW